MTSAPAQIGGIENVEDDELIYARQTFSGVSQTGPHPSQSTRLCDHCKQKADDKTQLKRCAGCGVVMYCSKECQRGAWPTHKALCRTSDIRSALEDATGFPTPQSLIEGIRTWVLIHDEALKVIATMTVRVHKDPPDKTIVDARRAVTFSVASTQQAGVGSSDSQGLGNPATAFRLQYAQLTDKDRYEWLSTQWPFLQEQCVNLDASMRGPARPNLLGCIPAVFVVEDTSVTFNTTYPVSRASRAVTAKVGGEPVARGVFKDTLALYSTAVNQGIVFRAPKDVSLPQPHGAAGKYEFVKNKWRWVCDAGWDWASVVDASGGKLGKMPTTNIDVRFVLAVNAELSPPD